MGSLQDGIYYKKGSRPGESLAIIFLRTDKTSSALEIGKIVGKIWDTCNDLKKGILKDIKDTKLDYPKLYNDLTMLIGYGPGIFDLNGSLKKKPKMFSNDLQFAERKKWGQSVFHGSDLVYHDDIPENDTAMDDIVIQFISNSQFVTNQGIVEIWRELSQSEKEQEYGKKLRITKFYDGFRRADNRNWMGFHDGVSNIKEEERKGVIAISRSQVQSEDQWLIDGTFMCFMRFFLDLQDWWRTKRNEQEIMVGRDKVTGCPIIGVDKITGNNIPMKGCPVAGTREVTDNGNELFRNHPAYGFQRLPPGVSDILLKFSHVGAMRKIKKQTMWKKEQYRIFRQGFEFLEQSESYPGLRAGLNFISFQNDPVHLFNTMTDWSKEKQNNTSNTWNNQNVEHEPRLGLNKYFRVGTAGLFLVPPLNSHERFPGSSIFFTASMAKGQSDIWRD